MKMILVTVVSLLLAGCGGEIAFSAEPAPDAVTDAAPSRCGAFGSSCCEADSGKPYCDPGVDCWEDDPVRAPGVFACTRYCGEPGQQCCFDRGLACLHGGQCSSVAICELPGGDR